MRRLRVSGAFICGLAAVTVAAIRPASGKAQTSNPPPAAPPAAAPASTLPAPFSAVPLRLQGPWDSTIRWEVFNRIRGEFGKQLVELA